MDNPNKNRLEKLNGLLGMNYNAEEGFAKASEKIDEHNFKSYLNVRSEKRKAFGKEIKEQIIALGGEPEKGTTLQGDLHHAWMDVKSVFAGNDTKAMMEECKRGEESALEAYQDARNELELPPHTASVLDKHMSDIRESLNEAKHLAETV